MRMTSISNDKERIDFAQKAAESFKENPEYSTFTEKDITPGCLFAVRWGLGNDCVLVFRLHEDEEVSNYQNIIK